MFKELKSLFTKPSLHHHSYSNEVCDDTVPEQFSILCWNVHKNNNNFSFKNYIDDFVKKKFVDFFVFQEANFIDERALNLSELTFSAAANLEKGDLFYGVLTASKCKTTYSEPFHSHGNELLFGPKKSFLITKHHFEDGTELLILNLHAINFRENRHYFKEIDQMLKIINDFTGPMIVAGDFNSWNKKRMKFLHSKMESLYLTAVPFSKEDKVKSFMRNHLDFIFYRGLELEEFSVERTHNLSDHHPLFAKFSLISS